MMTCWEVGIRRMSTLVADGAWCLGLQAICLGLTAPTGALAVPVGALAVLVGALAVRAVLLLRKRPAGCIGYRLYCPVW